MTQTSQSTRRLTLMAMLTAMAYVAMLITRPLPHVAGFLSYDLKDVIIVIGGFMLGPLPAMAIALVVSLIEMVTVSSTGPIGLVMNVLATCAFMLPPAILYSRSRTMRSAALGLALGVLLMTAMMLAWNYIITPLYMNVPRNVVAGMLIPTFLPFNLIKGGINAGITMLIYKPVTSALRRVGLLPPSAASGSPAGFNLTATLVSAVVVVTGIAVFVLMARG